MALPFPIRLREILELLERGTALRAISTPPKPAPGRVTLFVLKDSGTGKHELYAQFPTGAAQLISTEP
jgi:hypothetical protein